LVQKGTSLLVGLEHERKGLIRVVVELGERGAVFDDNRTIDSDHLMIGWMMFGKLVKGKRPVEWVATSLVQEGAHSMVDLSLPFIQSVVRSGLVFTESKEAGKSNSFLRAQLVYASDTEKKRQNLITSDS
jgi:hypothetical protein